MSYELAFTVEAEADLKSLDKTTARRILKKLQQVSEYEDVAHILKPLTGTWSEYSRIRVGSYRVICRVSGEQLVVHRLRKRSRVYRA